MSDLSGTAGGRRAEPFVAETPPTRYHSTLYRLRDEQEEDQPLDVVEAIEVG